jgi:predicted MFS family arabinose efflux permease
VTSEPGESGGTVSSSAHITGGATGPGALPGGLRLRLLGPTLIIVGSLMSVVSSLGAPLIPTIADADGVSLSTAEWLLTITLMTGALATPLMGRLSDGPRQRDVILAALGSVVAGCVVAALSNGFAMLIVGRGLQGVGLGLLPVAMAVARRNLTPEKSRQAIATLSVTAAIGAGLGYPVTALIAETFDYRGAYWFGAITVGAAFLLAAFVLPGRADVPSRRFDTVGATLISLVVVGLSVALSEAGGWGWASARTLGIFAACLVLLAAWIPYELRTTDPLIDLRQVKNRSVLTADTGGFLISVAMYLLLPVVVEFVQVPTDRGYGFGASLVVSGLVLMPYAAANFVASRFLGIYERRFGTRSMIPLGSLIFALGTGFFALEHSHLWEAFVVTGIAGFGMGFTYAAMPGFIVRAVPASETGSATGFYQVLRSIGLTLGSALSAAVLMAHTPAGSALPKVSGFETALLFASALAVATAVISFVLPGLGGGSRVRAKAEEAAAVVPMMEEEAELAGSGFMTVDDRASDTR